MSDLTASAERAVNLALRAGRYRTRAETAEAILADLVTAYGERIQCMAPATCNCPMARAIRHIEENR